MNTSRMWWLLYFENYGYNMQGLASKDIHLVKPTKKAVRQRLTEGWIPNLYLSSYLTQRSFYADAASANNAYDEFKNKCGE